MATLLPLVPGLLLLPLLAVLLMALCVHCRELPGEWGLAGGGALGHTDRDPQPARSPIPHIVPLALMVLPAETLRAPDSITRSPCRSLFLPHWPSLPQTHVTVLPPIGESAFVAGVDPLIPCMGLALGPLLVPYQAVSLLPVGFYIASRSNRLVSTWRVLCLWGREESSLACEQECAFVQVHPVAAHMVLT